MALFETEEKEVNIKQEYGEKLLDDTRNLLEPCHYHNFFDENFLSESDVLDFLHSIQTEKASANVRVFIDQGRRADYEDGFFKCSINKEDTVTSWVKRLFKDHKFGIVIGQAEQFNDKVAQKCAQFFEPIFQKVGLPLGGATITFFIGNYGFTPFGVHKDMEEKSIFHFHIGPGKKEMYLWNESDYKEATGTTGSFFEPDKIVEKAKKYTILPYDLFHLPASYYHIGYTDELSIGMALVLIDITNKKLTEEAIRIMYNEVFNYKTTYRLQNDIFSTNNDFHLEHIYPTHRISNYQTNTLSEWVESSASDWRLAKLSNFGFNNAPPMDTTVELNISDKKIQAIRPFNIYSRIESQEIMAIFVRNQKIIVRNHPAFPAMLEKINSGSPIDVAELIKPLLDVWKEEDALNLISLILRNHGVTVVS